MHVSEVDNQLSYWKDHKHQDYHQRQFDVPYRSTVHFADFMREVLANSKGSWNALDVCCGMGANIYYFNKCFPDWSWTGVDIVAEVLDRGRQIFVERSPGSCIPRMVKGDALDLSATLPSKGFQIVTSLQTLLCMPDPETALDNLLSMCAPGGWVFVSSLFTDFSVDVRMQITEYPRSNFAAPVGPAIYNILCFEKFRADCLERGARRLEAIDFRMDVDLAVPEHKVMGTYTLDIADGTKLQASGPILMPWKFVAIQAP